MTQIVHLADRDRWEAQDEQGRSVGYLSYALEGGVIDLQHTVVDPAARGQGLGGRLVETALQHARAEGLRVRPTCPFVPRYLAEHPEHADLLEGADDAHGDGTDAATVEIRDQSIRLGQLLKLAGLVQDRLEDRVAI